jgi:ATP-dependent Clp protease ATP-binding subunit ClpA
MMPNSRYSQHARRAMNYARLLAKENGHTFLDSTHLLIGILQEEGSMGCNVLFDLEMDVRRTERAFRQLARDDKHYITHSGPTRALQDALSMAANESRWLGQHYIGTEHFLLGLIHTSEPTLLDLLRILDINPEQIRRRVRRLLQEGITEISVEQAKRVARLSELSRRVLNAAEQLARQLNHKYVGLAHLLLVLARERRSICAQMLHDHHLDDVALNASLSKSRPATGGMLEDLVDRAVDRAESFGSHYTGTEHLLLTLALDHRGARLLIRYGVDPKELIRQMRDHLSR